MVTAFNTFRSKHTAFDGKSNVVLKLARRLLPVTNSYDGQRMTSRRDGTLRCTPLLLAILVVEISDVMFAVDSIPAILAITSDPFLVFASNVFAILGLRALFFLLAGFLYRLRYLKHGLVAILAFVGAKMMAAYWVHVPVLTSLGVIAGMLGVVALASAAYPSARRRIQEPLV